MIDKYKMDRNWNFNLPERDVKFKFVTTFLSVFVDHKYFLLQPNFTESSDRTLKLVIHAIYFEFLLNGFRSQIIMTDDVTPSSSNKGS